MEKARLFIMPAASPLSQSPARPAEGLRPQRLLAALEAHPEAALELAILLAEAGASPSSAGFSRQAFLDLPAFALSLNRPASLARMSIALLGIESPDTALWRHALAGAGLAGNPESPGPGAIDISHDGLPARLFAHTRCSAEELRSWMSQGLFRWRRLENVIAAASGRPDAFDSPEGARQIMAMVRGGPGRAPSVIGARELQDLASCGLFARICPELIAEDPERFARGVWNCSEEITQARRNNLERSTPDPVFEGLIFWLQQRDRYRDPEEALASACSRAALELCSAQEARSLLLATAAPERPPARARPAL